MGRYHAQFALFLSFTGAKILETALAESHDASPLSADFDRADDLYEHQHHTDPTDRAFCPPIRRKFDFRIPEKHILFGSVRRAMADPRL